MSRFIIGSTDLSAQINDKTAYEVNETSLFSSVTDANGDEHRNFYKTRVMGSFDMFFIDDISTQSTQSNDEPTLVSYATFLSLITNNSVNGLLTATVWVQNTATSKTLYCYPVLKMKKETEVNGKIVRIVTVTIEEK